MHRQTFAFSITLETLSLKKPACRMTRWGRDSDQRGFSVEPTKSQRRHCCTAGHSQIFAACQRQGRWSHRALFHGLVAFPQLPCTTPGRSTRLLYSRQEHLHGSPFLNTCMLVILEVCETPNLSSYFKPSKQIKTFFSFSIRRERAL